MAAAVVENEAGPSTTTTPGERAEVFKRLHPDEYISRFLAEGYRPDGRKLNGWRDVSVNIGMRLDNIGVSIANIQAQSQRQMDQR
jgi:exosome complex component RRP43